MNKVIGIGLPKTATSSLTGILNNNNIKTIHFGSPVCEEIRNKMYKGIYTFDTLNRYHGITNAFEMIFPQVDKTYPNSKFIYTIRKKSSWLVSIKKHWDRMINNPNSKQETIHHHLITFGTYYFNKDRFSFVYDSHKLMVENYFKDRLHDLLTIDITQDDDSVIKICDFLEIPVINKMKLHRNKSI